MRILGARFCSPLLPPITTRLSKTFDKYLPVTPALHSSATPVISTRDLTRLPDILTLRRLTRSLSMLDAILSPDWEARYYSFNSRWAESAMMASMRNGEGDEWHAIFCKGGGALQGIVVDAPVRRDRPVLDVFEGLPAEFQQSLLREPAFEAERSTFCIWRLTRDECWSTGSVRLPPGDDPDGSAGLLSILDGDPKSYIVWANEYYGRDLPEADVAAVYRHEPLTAELVSRLNPEVDLGSLAGDVAEIGFPEDAAR